MSGGDIALIIGAVATLITAITGASLALLVEVKKVHKIVNQHQTDMRTYQDLLTATLRAHGVEVPKDESLS